MKNCLLLKKDSDSVTVSNELYFCKLTRQTAGLPSETGYGDNALPILQTSVPIITATHHEYGPIVPVMQKFNPQVFNNKKNIRILFPDILWQNKTGEKLQGYRLSLDYIFNPDGAVFVNTFFYCDTLKPGRISSFCIKPILLFGKNFNANWAYWKFPKHVQADIIQNISHIERNLSSGKNNIFPHQIVPFFSFDFGQGQNRDKHMEFFVESFNSLTQDCKNTETSLNWNKNNAEISWNFQKKTKNIPLRTYQWSNTWGWCLRQTPVKRKMPFRTYHYLDNFKRYPADNIIQEIAEQEANLLILHENWRLDLKGQLIPYDIIRLKKTIECCHKNKIRIALYVRATEDGIRNEFAKRLAPFLKKDYDGIYMDYGSPVTYMRTEENAPSGRIPFQEYYNMTNKLREFVGKEGVLISHSGACFSGIGHTTVDSALTGEQEHGQIFNGRKNHAYLCGLSVCPASLWTAAFPHYRNKKLLSFLASVLQSPFLHLGWQVPSSSLAHPAIPAYVNFVRPLWRIWAIFDRFKYVHFHCDSTDENIINTDSPLTGASAMINQNGDLLITAANFSNRTRRISIAINYSKLKIIKPEIFYELFADCQFTSCRLIQNIGKLKTEIKPWGIHAWLLTGNKEKFQTQLKKFAQPYKINTKELESYKTQIREQKNLRFNPPHWSKFYLRVEIDNWPNNYEDSLWWDLFNNQIMLVERNTDTFLGFISTKGLTKEQPDKKNYIWPGLNSPWIPLHNITALDVDSNSLVKLSLISRKGKNRFYSFIKISLSPLPRQNSHTYNLTYNNDIDSDWSEMDFNIFKKSKYI